jgi:hypothetical protein
MATATLVRPGPGPIVPSVLYPLDLLKAKSGLGAAALRTARRTGLKVRYAGGRGFIMGRDFIQWVEQNGKETR